jgi:hypothetical protein
MEKHRGDLLNYALRKNSDLSEFLQNTLHGINDEQMSLVKKHLNEVFFGINTDTKSSDQLRNVIEIFERYNSRLMFTTLRMLTWRLSNLKRLEEELEINLPNHQSALALYLFDQKLSKCRYGVNPDKPIDKMTEWLDYFEKNFPNPSSIEYKATHQTSHSAAYVIQQNGLILPSSKTEYAHLSGVCIGLAGCFKNWIPPAKAVTFSRSIPLSHILPIFSATNPIPRALGIYPSHLRIQDSSMWPNWSSFIVNFSNPHASLLFTKSIEKLNLASCKFTNNVRVQTEKPFVTIASLALIAGATDCQVDTQQDNSM